MPKAFPLPETVTIQNIESIFRELHGRAMPAGEIFMIDAGQTALITTPGIQLILSLAVMLKASGGALSILKPKEAFKQAFSALGLARELAQWEKSV